MLRWIRCSPPRRLVVFSVAIVGLTLLALYSGTPANAAVSFTRTWGWGVSDGMSHFETCTSACQSGIAGAGAGQLSSDEGVGTDASGNVYVADYSTNRIDEFSATGVFTRAWGWGVSDGMSHFETCTSACQSGIAGGGAGQLHAPTDVATDASGNVYVADYGNNRIDEFSSTGAFTRGWGWGVSDGMNHFETCTSACEAGLPGGGAGQLGTGYGLGLTIASGNVYVADGGNNRIDEFSSTGAFTRAWGWGVSDGMSHFETCTSACEAGIPGEGAGQLFTATGVATDASGNVYVTDEQRIDEFSSTGAFTRAWGWGVSDGMSHFETCTSACQSGIGGGGAGQFNLPLGVAADAFGVYVADYGNNRIDELSSMTPQHTLTVSRSGSGSVTSSPAGISCGVTCSHNFNQGTAVILTAHHAAGSSFAGWSGGGCSGAGTCTVTLSADTHVTAKFTGRAPVLSALAVSPRTFTLTGRLVKGRCQPTSKTNRNDPRCTRPVTLQIGYNLSLAARVTLTFKRMKAGRVVNGRCVKATHTNRTRRHCTLLTRLPGSLARSGPAGTSRFTFKGRVGGHKLTPGDYRLTATPAANSRIGTSRTVPFRITS